MSSITEGKARSGIQSYDTARGRRWRVRYELPPDSDGNRRQRSKRGFTTMKEAQRFLRDVLGEVEEGSYIEPGKLTIQQWLEDEWLPSRKPHGSAARGHRGTVGLSTWEQYQTYIRAYVVPHLGLLPLQQLSHADLNRLYDRLETQGKRRGRCATAGLTCPDHNCSPELHDGLAPKTLTNVHGLIHKALSDAVRRGKLKRNVAGQIDPPTADRTLTRWWTPLELRSFVQHVREDRLYAAWLLFVTTGMRRGEVAGLAWEDGRMIHPERISGWFARHCRDAGLPRIRLHDVRHSYASAASAAGWHEVKVISERLGHANVAITIDTYSHVLPAADEATAHTLATAILGGS